MISPLTTFPRLTASEESNLILQDIFEYDSEAMNFILGDLCEENGIAFDLDLNGEEIDNLIIDNEDLIAHMYESYQNPEVAEEETEEEETEEEETEEETEEEETEEEETDSSDFIEF